MTESITEDTIETEIDELEPIKEYKLFIPLEIYQRLLAYVDNCKEEISGLADVEYNSTRQGFCISELYLVKQEVTGSNTEMDGDAIAKLYHDLIKKGQEQLPRLWWHSHCDMGVFWSGTDEATMRDLKNESYTIALETNHAHDLICRLIQWKPFPVVVDGVKVVVDMVMPKVSQSILKEIKSKVLKWSQPTTSGYLFGDKKDEKEDEKEPKEFIAKGDKSFKPTTYCYFPKNRDEAVRRVNNLQLIEVFDEVLKLFVWAEPGSTRRWIDKFDVFGSNSRLDEIRYDD